MLVIFAVEIRRMLQRFADSFANNFISIMSNYCNVNEITLVLIRFDECSIIDKHYTIFDKIFLSLSKQLTNDILCYLKVKV